MNVQDLSMSHHELRGLAIEHILDSQFNASRRAQEEKRLEKKNRHFGRIAEKIADNDNGQVSSEDGDIFFHNSQSTFGRSSIFFIVINILHDKQWHDMQLHLHPAITTARRTASASRHSCGRGRLTS